MEMNFSDLTKQNNYEKVVCRLHVTIKKQNITYENCYNRWRKATVY